LQLELELFKEFLELRGQNTKEEFFEMIIKWIKFDQYNRETNFSYLFDKINLDIMSKSFLNSVVAECDLVLQNHAASNKLVGVMKKYLSEEQTTEAKQQTDSLSLPSPKAPEVLNPIPTEINPKYEFLLVGGVNSPNYVRKLNTTTLQWTDLPDFPTADGSVDGQLIRYTKNKKTKYYYFGGRPSTDLNSFSETWCYDPAEEDWTECSNMYDKRHRFGCVYYRQQIYVAGGRAHKTDILSTVESFLPTKNQWNERPEMDENLVGCCLVVHRGKLIVLGGQKRHTFYNSMEVLSDDDGYSPEYDAEMNEEWADFAAVYLNGQIYAIGGKSYESEWLSSVETFDEYDLWEFVEPLNFPRSGHKACVLGNKIYVVGGENEMGPVREIEMYTPELDRWEVIGEIRGDPVGVAMVAMC